MEVAAIFDIDGTLVSFTFDAQGTRKALIAELQSWEVDTAGLGMSSPTQEILDAARARMSSGRQGEFEKLRGRLFSILDAFEMQGLATTEVFPGTRESLLGLKSSGVRLAVLTNSGRKAAQDTLRRANLQDCFEFVLTRDDTESMKPRPEGLLQAVLKLSLPKESVCYVGDSRFDVIAAKRAGVKSVAVATGSSTAELLRREGADFVVSSISEVGRILGAQPNGGPAEGESVGSH